MKPVISPKRRLLGLTAAGVLCGASTVPAVIHNDTGDPAAYTTTPGDNSGWQFEGQWGGFLGTPVAPYYFLSAKHIGQAGGSTFIFHGQTFNVVAGYPDPDTDLCLWRVDQPFPTYAPLFRPDPSGRAEVGQALRVFGCGAQRGLEFSAADGTLRGWNWGDSNYVERWGSSVVSDVVPGGDQWFFLRMAFGAPGQLGEAHLSTGDSGGGNFILQNGLWRLAAINYGVDDLYTDANGGGHFVAAIFDAKGFYTQTDTNTYTLITDDAPTSFYGTQVSSRLDWIKSVVDPHNQLPALPVESYDQWVQAYFTPDQIADSTVAGFGADPDGDGVPNGLEYAFNLDPTFAEPAVMTAGTGLRGLPLIQLENIAGVGPRLTVEFVRRTATSGATITYTTQFTSNLGQTDGWQAGGAESVTAINERWERVKVTDDAAGPARFARVLVTRTAATP